MIGSWIHFLLVLGGSFSIGYFSRQLHIHPVKDSHLFILSVLAWALTGFGLLAFLWGRTYPGPEWIYLFKGLLTIIVIYPQKKPSFADLYDLAALLPGKCSICMNLLIMHLFPALIFAGVLHGVFNTSPWIYGLLGVACWPMVAYRLIRLRYKHSYDIPFYVERVCWGIYSLGLGSVLTWVFLQ